VALVKVAGSIPVGHPLVELPVEESDEVPYKTFFGGNFRQFEKVNSQKSIFKGLHRTLTG
jgi:hypothetical protein